MSFLQELPWDSDFFGYKIGKISTLSSDEDLEGLNNSIVEAKNRGYDCLYIEVPLEAPKLADYSKKNKFKLVAIKTTLAKDRLETKDLSIAITDDKDEKLIPSLKTLSKQISTGSRFNFDPVLNAKVEDLYKLWIKKSIFEGFSDKFFYFLKKGMLVGFISAKNKKGQLFIDLFGVDTKYRREGIGSNLLQAIESWALSKGFNEIRTVTQAHNIEALRTYQKNGYLITEQKLFYHKWINKNV